MSTNEIAILHDDARHAELSTQIARIREETETMTTTTKLTGAAAIEYAEAHGLTLAKYTDPAEGARDGLTPDEARAIAREDPSLIYLITDHCECGETSGVRCDWTGPRADTVVVEWMPEQHRASHTAAGNGGVYPLNGARRLRVAAECADRIIEADGEWTWVVETPTTRYVVRDRASGVVLGDGCTRDEAWDGAHAESLRGAGEALVEAVCEVVSYNPATHEPRMHGGIVVLMPRQ